MECPGNKRDRDTLETIILDRVALGSTIYTDGWGAYKNLSTLGYTWDMVNHSGKVIIYSNKNILILIYTFQKSL